jgi:hypothetical protein
MASTALKGAVTPLAVLANDLRMAAHAATPASRSAIFTVSSRVLRGSPAEALAAANAMASSSSDPVAT